MRNNTLVNFLSALIIMLLIGAISSIVGSLLDIDVAWPVIFLSGLVVWAFLEEWGKEVERKGETEAKLTKSQGYLSLFTGKSYIGIPSNIPGEHSFEITNTSEDEAWKFENRDKHTVLEISTDDYIIELLGLNHRGLDVLKLTVTEGMLVLIRRLNAEEQKVAPNQTLCFEGWGEAEYPSAVSENGLFAVLVLQSRIVPAPSSEASS